MQVTITTQDQAILAVLEGRLDTAAAPQFQADINPLMEQADKAITLDCSQLSFISSSGLRLFLNLLKAAKAQGGSVTIRQARPEILQVFAMTGLDRLFAFQD